MKVVGGIVGFVWRVALIFLGIVAAIVAGLTIIAIGLLPLAAIPGVGLWVYSATSNGWLAALGVGLVVIFDIALGLELAWVTIKWFVKWFSDELHRMRQDVTTSR